MLLMGKISGNFAKGITRAIGLAVFLIGVSSALRGDIMLMVISMAAGSFIGEILKIDDGINRFGMWIQKKFSKSEGSSFADGFITSSLLFCVGAMAIVGSLDSGLRDDQSVIIAKSVLDGVTSLVFASTMGIGVLFSAVPVFVYQGAIEFFAGFVQHLITDTLIAQISGVGGLMIIGIGANMVLDAKIKVANLLPGFVIAVGYYFVILA